MISLKDWMETVNYRITEGSSWNSESYGYNAYSLSAWNGVHGNGGWSLNIVFDTETQEVYQVEVCDYTNNRAYSLINPLYKEAHDNEVKDDPYGNQAWDDVNFTELDVDEDWLEKARAIVAGDSYDTRISVPLEFTDQDLLTYMKLAHEQDLTFNQFVEKAIRHGIEEFERDPEGMKARAKKFTEG